MYSFTILLTLLLLYCCYFQQIISDVIKDGKGDIAFPDDLHVKNHPAPYTYHSHHHYHHHPEHFEHGPHQHSAEFHYGHTGMEEGGHGRDEYDAPKVSKQIPLDFILNISRYEVNDLLLNFVERENEEEDGMSLLLNRFGEDERNAAVMAKEASCLPEIKTVKLLNSDDPSILYIPECTRIEKCGGCCRHTLLSCQPVETEMISFQVLKLQYSGEKKLKLLSKEVVPMEKHTKCKCDCKIKAEDCNKFQQYKKSECRCACVNTDEEKKCGKNNETKLWNPELCACQCRNELECSTGSVFDRNLCKCVPMTVKRRNALYVMRSSNIQPVEPLID